MPQAIELRQTGPDNDRVVTGEFVQFAGQDMVADGMQRAQIVQRDAAHQPAARAAAVGGQQRLAVQHRQCADDAGDGADAVEQRLVVVDRIAGEGLDGDVAVDAEYAAFEFGLEAAHDAGHHDQRGDAERDADQREHGDDRDKALALARAQIAAGDRAFEGSEHSCYVIPAKRGPSRWTLAFAGVTDAASASSGESSLRSPDARRFSSTLPAAAPRGPTMICQG